MREKRHVSYLVEQHLFTPSSQSNVVQKTFLADIKKSWKFNICALGMQNHLTSLSGGFAYQVHICWTLLLQY